MRSSRFGEERIIGILRKHEAGVTTTEACRLHGISDATFYKWKAKYGGLEVSEARLWLLKNPGAPKSLEFGTHRRDVAGMLALVRSIVSVLARQFRSWTVLELGNLALRHHLHVLRRQRLGRPRLFTIDRLLWVWLYQLWPRCLNAMVLVKPATVVR